MRLKARHKSNLETFQGRSRRFSHSFDRDGTSLRETLEPLEGVVDENPVLVAVVATFAAVATIVVDVVARRSLPDRELDLGELVKVGRVVNGPAAQIEG